MEKIFNGYVNEKDNNEMLAKGYLYKVNGDWEIDNEHNDPWSGMPEVKKNIHYFTDLNEATEYANAQVWVFNSNIRGTVETVEYEKTLAELEAEENVKKAEKAKKKAERIAEKAKELNITVEEYERRKKVEATKRRYTKDIAELRAEIEKLEKAILWKEEYIKNN